MSKSKSTKRSLLLSSLSIAMCCAMLTGTTFAWFTDTASASINSIQAGILDIELQTKDADGNWVDATNQYLSFVKATGAEDEEILWEPGCTYKLQDLRIINKSNLALKYKVEISGIRGDSKLNEAIDWTIELDGNNVTAGEEMVWLPSDNAESMVKEFTISGHMKETAGNEYQGLSIDDASITVLATQYTYEHDSIDDKYDENAQYPIVRVSELRAAIKDRSKNIITLGDDLVVSDTQTYSNKKGLLLNQTYSNIFNLEDNVISASNGVTADFGMYIVGNLMTKVEINAQPTGGIDTSTADAYCINLVSGYKASNVTINGGTYKGVTSCVQVQGGTCIINGGFFEVVGDSTFLLNIVDSTRSRSSIQVKGGTFVNFNPADNTAEGVGTSFVADGYTVVSEVQTNGDAWYTVVPE